ncbi:MULTISPECIES: helix-turn-helix transcriptional regulator [Streptomyces]|uniref:helix-turn-helix transcriptional regulator n=1 Tax=Streptomyces TaxID=1883 RepID=UPI001CC901AE|nr:MULTISPECIES: helix-turn-helix transcriptional regulator [Streptomyces]UBI38911.1 helix-turn-helix transcriptional regulator [Streptomyces mobaraensis]UKW31491.1 helix-turn-helix transcriptional regulator [Streptomyces sp. TYQ1024]
MTTAPRADGGRPHRRDELRRFLMTRRARVTPAEAGLPAGGVRRTPGLRREEVAVLAGVGTTWYQWLEQGRDITVSPQVLDGVARVLRLSSVERRHLYVLAGLNPPPPESGQRPDDLCPGLRRLIDGWLPWPAHILDPCWNTVAHNAAAALVWGFRPGERRNWLADFFTDPGYRTATAGPAEAARREENARRLVAQFRASRSERPGSEAAAEVAGTVAGLCALSGEFARLWEAGDVHPEGQLVYEIDHPGVGRLCFESSPLRIPSRPDLTIAVHNPVPGTGTAEKVERLVAG